MNEQTHIPQPYRDLYEAAQVAANVLFLLQDEVAALGLRAQNVREKLSAAIAKASGAA